MPDQGRTLTGDPTRAALSRELSEFLIQLSIAIHRYHMYPDGHPSLGPTVDNLIERLAALLDERGTLSLGVARNQLVIEGVATDTKNPVLRDLAGRLHRHHLGAVTFTRGVYYDELRQVLQLIAVEADHSEPLGLNPEYRRGAVWEHVRLYPLTYDRLELVGQQRPDEDEDDETRASRTRAAQLWVGLARAALASDAADAAHADSDETPDPTVVAQAIQKHDRDAAYDQVIVGYMLQIADELKTGRTPESIALKKRVSTLVSTLDRGTLGRLLEMGGDRGQRRQFLLSASEGMAVDAVLELVESASEQEGETISNSMLRMLQKLAQHAESSRGQRRKVAETSVREQIMKLVRDWSLKDPNPDAYRQALKAMSASNPIFSVAPDARFRPEPRRVLEMALELDAMGEPVERAVDELASDGQLPWLLKTIAIADAPAVVEAVWQRVATPDRIRQVVERDPLDTALLDLLLPRMGAAAAPPMLDALTTSDSSQTRRVLLDRLVGLGPAIAPPVLDRLQDERWYVVRNMLNLLAELPQLPAAFDPMPFMDHADARVRREALRLLLREEATRDRAICLGLADADDRAVRLALTAATQRAPEAAVPLLVSRVSKGTNTDQRVAALRALAATRSRAALDVLLQIAEPRKGLLGTRLPARSPEYLTALAGLRDFPDNERAREALAAAARSKDPDIVRAAVG